MVEKYGDEALNTMLQAYGEELDTNAAPTYERAQALLFRII